MKSYYTSVLAILATATIVGMLTVGTQQIYAPRNCGGCISDFKKLTNEFEKDIISKVSEGQDPDTIYREVTTLFNNYQEESIRILGLTPPS
jgi:hypothetical protein